MTEEQKQRARENARRYYQRNKEEIFNGMELLKILMGDRDE